MRQPSADEIAAFEQLDPGDQDFAAICARIADVLDDVAAHPLTALMALANVSCVAIASIDDATARHAMRDAFVRSLNDAAALPTAQFDA